MGRITVVNDVLTQRETLDQIYQEFNSLLPASSNFVKTGNGDSIAIGDTYTGSVLNRLNQNLVTEQGWLGLGAGNCGLISRSNINDLLPATITFAREASGAYQFAYSSIERIQLGTNFVNTSTVIPPVATAQTAVDAASVALYGTYGQTVSTVDYDATQALGLAEWIAASRSDPTILQFVIKFNNLDQDLYEFISLVAYVLPIIIVKYRVPGEATDRESLQIVQGLQFEITNVGTFFTMTTSPFSYYEFEIEYNQPDNLYDQPIEYQQGGNW